MALRLLELLVPPAVAPGVLELLADQPVHDYWQQDLADDRVLFRILLSTDQTETVADRLTRRFGRAERFRLLLHTVEATLPKPEEADGSEQPAPRYRVSREELYQAITRGVDPSPVFYATVLLSSLVAAIGLIRSDVAIIIGAMVIAPLLSPNMALALGATLGDLGLIGRAVKAKTAAMAIALLAALIIGALWQVDPGLAPELEARTRVGPGDIVLALAAGSVGSLAFTAGVPAALIGVMVAVALLPPLVSAGLLVGAGLFQPALGAMLLYLINVACLNLAAGATFLLQGIRPRDWWEHDAARRYSRMAVFLWLLLAVVLAGLVAVYRQAVL